MKGGIALLAVVPSLALACINDRDTLKFEQQNVDALKRIEGERNLHKKDQALKDLALRAIAGRFDRFPNKYYEVRIDLLKAKKSLTAEEYDDLAVAYDRIGNIDAAISTAQKSKSVRKSQDDWYRFHANYGTFLVHRWAANGSKADDTDTLKKSIEEIEEALKINPKSHFGRERVQLALQKTWLNPAKKSDYFKALTNQEISVGMSGIIMMGLGYELPDAYLVLARMTRIRGGLVDGVALHRYTELVNAGKPALVASKKEAAAVHAPEERLAEYQKLRADGEAVYKAREKYFFDHLTETSHPDTNPNFWSEWKEPAQPIAFEIQGKRITNASTMVPILASVGLASLIGATGAFIVIRRRR